MSLLATAPAIEDASGLFSDLADVVDFGLHVCLTSEWRSPRFSPSKESARGLARDDGTFPASVRELSMLAPSQEVVLNEVQSQYARLTALGFELSYLDEHMPIGDVAGIADTLTDFANQHGLVYDRTLRNAQVLTPLPGWNGPGPHPGTELADRLSSIDQGTYLIVGHPGFKSDEMQALRPDSGEMRDIIQERNRDRRMFADIEIVDYCDNARIILDRYSNL